MGLELRLCGGHQRRKGGAMIKISNISLPPAAGETELLQQTAKLLRVSPSEITRLFPLKKSIDARKKPEVRVIWTVEVSLKSGEERILKKKLKNVERHFPFTYPIPKVTAHHRPVIVGFGPAGMFAGLVLAKAGCRPIILERGQDAQTRHRKVEEFWQGGKLDPECNVQFGEGGAGTFSDGKLNTNTHNPRIRWVLEQFVSHGAHENILYDAKPHVGTDVLLKVVQNIRKEIIALGGDVRFGAKVTGLEIQDQAVVGVRLGAEVLACRQVILAIGHSARDTFAMLHETGIPMEPKPFAMGVRIEHPQTVIDLSQFGAEDPHLPPADYKLVEHLADGRTVYSFCMCPGGYVVAAASEDGGLVTNGMSYHDRSGRNANAALLVNLNPRDFPYEGVLGGVQWQREIEQAGYQYSGSYRAPAQKVGDFLNGVKTSEFGCVCPTYRPGVVGCDLRQVLPPVITDALKQAIPAMGRKIKGYDHPDAVLTAPETRSSSPVRILRDAGKQSSIRGLYPCGEGAGYAGGITSAAVDGMVCAEEIIAALRK